MAKVKIQGHASGTGILTVTAPDTDVNRTITLPDATGTLATTADTTDIDGAVTINDTGADVDFRVESDTDANSLFVQGSDGNIGIGTGTPTFPVMLSASGNALSGTNVDVSELSMKIWNPENDTGEAVGIGFGVTTSAESVGAAIIHDRVGVESYGNLHFATCPTGGGGGADIPIRMTIKHNGPVLVGQASGSVIASTYKLQAPSIAVEVPGDDTGMKFNRSDAAEAWVAARFYTNEVQVGYIQANTSSTTYSTSSDHRLKENVNYDFDATTRLKQLKPVTFNWIADETNTSVDGFIAHEVSSIVPEAIVGEKDAMTTEVLYVKGDELPEGKSIGDVKEASVIDPQGIDQSKLVPLLVKTIQELEARITALEAT